MKAFMLGASLALAATPLAATAINDGSKAKTWDNIVSTNGILGFDGLGYIIRSSDLNFISYNGTKIGTFSIAATFATVFAAVLFFTLLPDRALRGLNNLVSPLLPGSRRYFRGANDIPPPFYYDDYESEFDSFRSESRYRLPRRQRHRGRRTKRSEDYEDDQPAAFFPQLPAATSYGNIGDLDFQDDDSSTNARSSIYPAEDAAPRQSQLSLSERMYNFATRPYRLLRRSYDTVYNTYYKFWHEGGNAFPLMSPFPRPNFLSRLYQTFSNRAFRPPINRRPSQQRQYAQDADNYQQQQQHPAAAAQEHYNQDYDHQHVEQQPAQSADIDSVAPSNIAAAK